MRPSKLRGALDIWSQFFISPLIKPESAKREMKAVDSEHQNSLQKDDARVDEVIKHTSNPLSPFSKFSCGSLKTLGEDPAKRGVDVVARVRAFRKRHYVAPNMRLVLYGREPPEALAALARDLFKDIPSKASPATGDGSGSASSSSSSSSSSANSGDGSSSSSSTAPRTMSALSQAAALPHIPIRTKEQLGVRIDVVAVEDVHTLFLQWPMPSAYQHYRKKAAGFLSGILGSESRGSLFAVLRKRAWADGVTTTCVHTRTETEKGRERQREKDRHNNREREKKRERERYTHAERGANREKRQQLERVVSCIQSFIPWV